MSGDPAAGPWNNFSLQDFLLDVNAIQSLSSQGSSTAPVYGGIPQPSDTQHHSGHQRSQLPGSLPRTHDLHGSAPQNPGQPGYTVPALAPQARSGSVDEDLYTQAVPFSQHTGLPPRLIPHGTLQPSGYNQNVVSHYGVSPRECPYTFQGYVPQPRMVEFTVYPAGSDRTMIGGQRSEGYPEPRYIPQHIPEHPQGPMNAEDPEYGQNGCPRPRSQGFLVSTPPGPPLRHGVTDFSDSKFQRKNGAVPYFRGPMNNSRLPTRPLAAKHVGFPSTREQTVQTQQGTQHAAYDSHRLRNHNSFMDQATARDTGSYTREMDPTQKGRSRRRFSDVEKARIRVVRKAGACTECKSKKRRCTHVATSTSTDQLTPPRTASELGDSVSLGSTQTSNATQSSPDTILEEIDHDGTDLDSQYDPAFEQLFPEGTTYPVLP